MALATSPITFSSAVVAVAATAVAPGSPIPDNCKEVILLNIGTVPALYGIAAPGAAALTEGTNASRIPAGSALTLAVGTIATRGIMDQAQAAGSGLVFAGVGGTPTVNLTYINVFGPLV